MDITFTVSKVRGKEIWIVSSSSGFYHTGIDFFSFKAAWRYGLDRQKYIKENWESIRQLYSAYRS